LMQEELNEVLGMQGKKRERRVSSFWPSGSFSGGACCSGIT